MKGALTLVCAKCTRFAVFPAEDRSRAEIEANRKGWVERKGKTICPKCPK